MKPGRSIPHSQGHSNNPYPECNPIPRIDNKFFEIYCNIVLPYMPRLSKRSFPVGLPVKILKALLPSSILAIFPAHLNLLNLIKLTISNNGTKYVL